MMSSLSSILKMWQGNMFIYLNLAWSNFNQHVSLTMTTFYNHQIFIGLADNFATLTS